MPVERVEWINGTGKTIGIVRAKDTVTGEVFVYVGVGGGYDEEQDVTHILEWGAKMTPEVFADTMRRVTSKT